MSVYSFYFAVTHRCNLNKIILFAAEKTAKTNFREA